MQIKTRYYYASIILAKEKKIGDIYQILVRMKRNKNAQTLARGNIN